MQFLTMQENLIIPKFQNSDEEVFTIFLEKENNQKGDVLIPTVGTIGNASYSKLDRGAIAQNLIALRVNNQNDSLFCIIF